MRLEDLDPFAAEVREETGPRRERAQPARELLRGTRPVGGRVLAPDRPARGGFAPLRTRRQRSRLQAAERLDEELSPDRRQPGGERTGRLALADRHAPLEVDRPRVEPLVHSHCGRASLAVSGEDRRLHGRGTPVARQERGVDVDAAERRQAQQLGRKDPAVRDHRDRVRPSGRERLPERRVAAQPLRFLHREIAARRPRPDGRRLRRRVPADRAVRLGDDERHRKAGVDERRERRHGEFGSAEEDDPRRHGIGSRGVRRASSRVPVPPRPRRPPGAQRARARDDAAAIAVAPRAARSPRRRGGRARSRRRR